MVFKPTSLASRNNNSRFSRWYLPSSGSATFHSTQVRTVLKPSSFIFDKSSFQSLGESGVMVSSIGARALPPLYHTATGKNVWLVLLCLTSERGGRRASCEPGIRTGVPVEASTLTASATMTNDDGLWGMIRSRLPD